MSVGSPLVTGVTFFLVHKTAAGESKLFEIGRAEAVHDMQGTGTLLVWAHTADTVNWPVANDERIILLARTELGDTHGPVAWANVEVNALPGDFNRDGRVDEWDLLEFQAAWLAGEERADINGDGAIDIHDFVEFQAFLLDH